MRDYKRHLLEQLGAAQKYTTVEEVLHDLQNIKDESTKLRLLSFVWSDIGQLVKNDRPSKRQLESMSSEMLEEWREGMEFEFICGFCKGVSHLSKQNNEFANLAHVKQALLACVRKSCSNERRKFRKRGFPQWHEVLFDEDLLKNKLSVIHEMDSFYDIYRLLVSYLRTLEKSDRFIFANSIGKRWYKGDNVDGYLSAEELSRHLKQSKVQIYNRLNNLRAEFRSLLIENHLLA